MSESSPHQSEYSPGEVHEGFKLLEFVAQGPFSEVWRAERGEEFAALKFARGEVGDRMLAEEARVLGFLEARRRTARQLEAPEPQPRQSYEAVRVAVGALHFAEACEARPAILATLWIPEGTLRDRFGLVQSADERARAVALVCELTTRVGILHYEGVVHGDLKPENALVNGDEPLLMDFGLARHLREARLGQSLKQSLQSQDALTGGTMAYMAPEIVKGGEPSAKGDVYALGVMLHEALVGRRPSKVTTPEELKRLVPEALIPILLQALAYDPEDRFRNAQVLWTALDAERDSLTATGLSRRARSLFRFVRGGLAAVFVAFRYLSVVILLSSYLAILVGTGVAVLVSGWLGLLWLFLFLPILLFHVFVRWEGPETASEAAARGAGNVVTRRNTKTRRGLGF